VDEIPETLSSAANFNDVKLELLDVVVVSDVPRHDVRNTIKSENRMSLKGLNFIVYFLCKIYGYLQ
jgi:hypothetical protein